VAKSCITLCFTYSLRMAIFLNTDISQGSVATRLGCDGVFVHDFVANFLLSLTVKDVLKIGQYLVKLWARVRCLVFFDSRCILHRESVYYVQCSGVNASSRLGGRTTEWGKSKVK